MRDDEIGVVRLPVERHQGDHDAGQAAEREDEQEAEDEQRGRLNRRRPDAMVAIQAKTWMPLGTETAMLAAEKKPSDSSRDAGREHVVHPQAEAEEAGGDERDHDQVVGRRAASRAMVGMIIDTMPAAGRKMM